MSHPSNIRAGWLEAMGLEEETIAELLDLMEKSGDPERQDVAITLAAAFGRVLSQMKSSVRCAVIPAAGAQHRLLAPHVMQRLLLRVVSEATVTGITEIVFVLAPGVTDALFGPLDEALRLSIVPQIRLQWCVQAEPTGLGEAILQTENLVGSQRFAVLLPDDVLTERSRRVSPPDLQRMIRAKSDLGEGSLVAVTHVPRAKMSRSGVVLVEGREVREGIRKVAKLVERPEPSHPILQRESGLYGIVGRYIFDPGIFGVLGTLRKKTRPSVLHLTDGIEKWRAEGHPVYSFELESTRRHDVGELLESADQLIGRNPE